MARELRIVKQGSSYIIQQKCLWWWVARRHAVNAEVTATTRFLG